MNMHSAMEADDLIEVPKEMNLTVGGDDDETPATPPAPKEAEKPVEKATIYLGGRRFDSQEEFINFATQELQKPTRQESNSSQVMDRANQPKPSDLMFSDPDAYHELTLEEAEKRVMSKLDKATAEQRVWNGFYEKYPDLKDGEMKDLVRFKFEQAKKDKGNLPADQLLDTIGKEVRSFVGKVRGRPEGGKELPSGSAIVASSGNNIPPTKKAAESEPTDMASQIRKWQKRGR